MELSLRDLRELLSDEISEHCYIIGANYFIRTVTYFFTGRLKAVLKNELILTDAAWIADTGRFTDAIKSCNFNEVEPYPDGELIINRQSIIDAFKIDKLPREQK